MPSRKRNKGRERKAKKVERSLSKPIRTWIEWIEWSQKHEKIRCDHGKVIQIPTKNHPVSQFMELFLAPGEAVLIKRLQEMLVTLPEIWEDHNRNAAVEILTVIATNQLLQQDEYGVTKDQSSDVYIAQAIVILENYDGGGDIRSTFHTPKVANRLTDLRCSSSPKSALPSRRDLLKFLSKRISCSCLKEKYRYARRTLPKFSACSWCGQQKKRELILVCNNCKIELYCGEVCQAASWNNVHKHECAHFVGYQCM